MGVIEGIDHDDIFSLVDERTAKSIADICSNTPNACVCVEIGNVVRRERGLPQIDVLEDDPTTKEKLLKTMGRDPEALADALSTEIESARRWAARVQAIEERLALIRKAVG